MAMRRFLVLLLLTALGVTAVGAFIQARRLDSASDPGWAEPAGPLEQQTTTPLLSVRRAPAWLSAPVAEARLAERISEVVELPSAPPQTCLVAYRGDEQMVNRLGDTPLVPSSLMKIVTATAILEKAGPAATYTTEVFVRRDAATSISDGVLAGDLYLVGRGDPVLSTRAYVDRFDEPVAFTDFTDLALATAQSMRNLGVNSVQGSIVADESRFPEAERDYTGQLVGREEQPIWKPSYVEENQVGPLSALLLNDGYESFAASDSYANRRFNVRAEDPALETAQTLIEMLASLGIEIIGGSTKGVAPALTELRSVAQVESPPMSQIVERMLSRSDNTTAEMLLKEIGRRSSHSERAWAVLGVYDVLQRQLGLPTDGLVISDGSGLSLHNRLTCELIAELLRRAGPDSPLALGLAVAGETGTLRDCDAQAQPTTASAQPEEAEFQAEPAPADASEIRAKTGTLNDVSALAGLTASDGDVLTFAMIANREGLIFDLGPCNELQRLLIAAAAGHPYGPSPEDLSLRPIAAAPSPEPATNSPTDPTDAP